ncbi:MAG: hypothetical protein CML02_02425 [Pseudooceanicola sp.]|nr:hypothetical protein [Pseudooceanicola sp.]|tara:strand:- start:42 stop:728 length:687 start_codon:yes stop_codon:yes gene_type:complete
MSHKATNWLSSLPAEALGNSEFRVLFHLCDCHNPSRGCFPTQEYLKEATGVSNGTLNNALNGLEAKKLIARHRSFDNKTRRQRPTRYLLGFELPKEGEPSPEFGDGPGGDPTPETGDGTGQKPSPKTGDGAVSNLGGDGAQNTTAASRARANAGSSRRAEYFVPRADSALSPGVYQRKGEKLTKVLAFSEVAPSYSKRFPMEAHAEKVARDRIELAFDRAFARAMRGS